MVVLRLGVNAAANAPPIGGKGEGLPNPPNVDGRPPRGMMDRRTLSRFPAASPCCRPHQVGQAIVRHR